MIEHSRPLDEELHSWLAGATKVVVAGVGNSIRSDDFVGVKVVMDLQGRTSGNVRLIECETVPESFVDEIVEIAPTNVLLVDSAVFGHPPGTAHLYEVEEVVDVPAISTHALPLRVFSEYVHRLTGAKIALVLIEPMNMDFGEGLSPEVDAAARRIAAILAKELP